MSNLAARVLAGISETGDALALAVSGGGDSMALLHLAAALRPLVVTVDHGLRPEAADEAAEVGRVCAKLGLRHTILRWHWDGKGNLQDAARRGRRQVMADWARGAGVRAVALGHTRDDVAETLLMRLARGAGVDGLAEMSGRWHEGGITWLRPLLGCSRADLRAYLQGQGATWVEDPSNDNMRFDRVRMRKALAGMASLGLTAETLAGVAGHMAQAREALERATDDLAARALAPIGNAIHIDQQALAGAAPEIQRRLILRVIQHIAPADYGPRGPALQALLARLLAGKPAMLGGCRFLPGLWAFREAKAVAGLRCPADQVWDGSWRMAGPIPDGAEIAALGPGIALCAGWRATGVPRAALVSSPAMWLGGRLIAAPHAGFGPGYSIIPLFPAAALHHSTLSH